MVQEINREEHMEKVRLGEKAKAFLQSEEWTVLLKPMLDSFAMGLLDASDIDVSSDKKAAIEVKSRVEAAKYVRSIEKFLEGYVIEGEQSAGILSPAEDKIPLYRKKREYK